MFSRVPRLLVLLGALLLSKQFVLAAPTPSLISALASDAVHTGEKLLPSASKAATKTATKTASKTTSTAAKDAESAVVKKAAKVETKTPSIPSTPTKRPAVPAEKKPAVSKAQTPVQQQTNGVRGNRGAVSSGNAGTSKKSTPLPQKPQGNGTPKPQTKLTKPEKQNLDKLNLQNLNKGQMSEKDKAHLETLQAKQKSLELAKKNKPNKSTGTPVDNKTRDRSLSNGASKQRTDAAKTQQQKKKKSTSCRLKKLRKRSPGPGDEMDVDYSCDHPGHIAANRANNANGQIPANKPIGFQDSHFDKETALKKDGTPAGVKNEDVWLHASSTKVNDHKLNADELRQHCDGERCKVAEEFQQGRASGRFDDKTKLPQVIATQQTKVNDKWVLQTDTSGTTAKTPGLPAGNFIPSVGDSEHKFMSGQTMATGAAHAETGNLANADKQFGSAEEKGGDVVAMRMKDGKVLRSCRNCYANERFNEQQDTSRPGNAMIPAKGDHMWNVNPEARDWNREVDAGQRTTFTQSGNVKHDPNDPQGGAGGGDVPMGGT